MGARDICYIDTETTGTGWYHELYEVAVVKTTADGEFIEQFVTLVKPENLVYADPFALSIGRFSERHERAPHAPNAVSRVWERVSGCDFAGITVSFDARMVGDWFKRNNLPPFPWHYRLLDVSTYAAGIAAAAGWVAPGHMPGSDDIFDLFGITIPAEERHTALGDAKATHRLHMAAKDVAAGLRVVES